MLLSVKLGSMRSNPMGVRSISVFGTNTAASNSISLPASIIAGDFIVLHQFTRSAIGDAAAVTPGGFTNIHSLLNSQNRSMIDVKIANGTEGGTSITGMDDSFDFKIVVVYRGDVPITGYTVNSLNEEGTTGNPAAQNVTSSSGTVPLVVLGHYCSTGTVSPRTFGVTADAELTADVNFYIKYKIYNSSPLDVSVDMDDEGSNILASLYISFT